MDRILVATDFSTAARWAVDYAGRLAGDLDARLDILHAHSLTVGTGLYGAADDLIQRQIRSKMAELIRNLELITGHIPAIQPRIMEGPAISSILQLAPEYDLLVMGSQGQSDIGDWLMGSTTLGVLKKMNFPVLVIPPQCTYQKLQHLVLAIDESGIDHEGMVHTLLDITRLYQPQLSVVHHVKGQDDRGLDVDLSIYFEGIPYSLHIDMGDGPSWEAVLDFARDEKADLLAMIRRQRHGLERWFSISSTRQTIKHADLPVLVLSDAKKSGHG